MSSTTASRTRKYIKATVIRDSKFCPACEQDLPISSFYTKGAYFDRYCKTCSKIKKKEWWRNKKNSSSEASSEDD